MNKMKENNQIKDDNNEIDDDDVNSKKINDLEDLQKWIGSSTFEKIFNFIKDLQTLVIGKMTDDEIKITKTYLILFEILEHVCKLIDKNPVLNYKSKTRFGKIEFRNFYDNLLKESESILKPLLCDFNVEYKYFKTILEYFNQSWGNKIRIDYGSGHELNFICFLICLKDLLILQKEDYDWIVLKIFTKYIEIMRKLQKVYWLEPAGSHGVWGLDDFHFLPFLFGASQLSTHPHIKPKLIHNYDLVDLYLKKFIYLDSINFIMKNVSSFNVTDKQEVSLRTISPMLDDILGAKSWEKIKGGMLKMYKSEVLSNFSIMQHFIFSVFLPCPQEIKKKNCDNDKKNHINCIKHTKMWNDCCGIKIPSIVAVSDFLNSANKK